MLILLLLILQVEVFMNMNNNCTNGYNNCYFKYYIYHSLIWWKYFL